jgi:hypothetical protein
MLSPEGGNFRPETPFEPTRDRFASPRSGDAARQNQFPLCGARSIRVTIGIRQVAKGEVERPLDRRLTPADTEHPDYLLLMRNQPFDVAYIA